MFVEACHSERFLANLRWMSILCLGTFAVGVQSMHPTACLRNLMIYRTFITMLLLVSFVDANAEFSDSLTNSGVNIAPKYYSGFAMQDLSKELMELEPAFAQGGVLVKATVSGSAG
jgi:hypothetical protein